MFTFDPTEYAPVLAAQDYVHIPHGLTLDFYRLMCGQVDEYYDTRRLSAYARGDKQQFLYEFPSTEHYQEFIGTLAALSGLPAAHLVISERHIKGYEREADPRPMPHKDRHATQLAVGFTVKAPVGSALILYPEGERSINPFSSWIEMRASLRENELPTALLASVPRVEIQDRPGDVVVFLGNRIWHGRENGAGTVMLYFKLNACHSDPLSEDPGSAAVSQRSRELSELPDEQLLGQVAILGRRVDYLHRRYSRDWQEILGVVLYGETHLTLKEREWKLLRALDGHRRLAEVLAETTDVAERASLLDGVRWLARRGIIDLI